MQLCEENVLSTPKQPQGNTARDNTTWGRKAHSRLGKVSKKFGDDSRHSRAVLTAEDAQHGASGSWCHATACTLMYIPLRFYLLLISLLLWKPILYFKRRGRETVEKNRGIRSAGYWLFCRYFAYTLLNVCWRLECSRIWKSTNCGEEEKRAEYNGVFLLDGQW